MTRRRLELLAPAKDYDVAIAAINCGADAIYMGAEGFGARSAASNSVADVARVVEYAHQFNVKVYVTLNTLIYDDELASVEAMIRQLYRVGVDALIIQDMGILRMDIPPIELHASTQCDVRTPEKAAFLEALGFSQIVLARELNRAEIAEIRRKTSVRLEAFVHGALCVSYSGRCQVSQALKGRSANRGECAQVCRLSFDLVDGAGNTIARNKHLLSLRDFNLSDQLPELIAAGVDSFKIEGRLKDANYVRNAVAYYRREIDKIIANNPEQYERTSCGDARLDFVPELEKGFNRRFTHYFFDSRNPGNGATMASTDTPKAMGEKTGKVVRVSGKNVVVASSVQFNNGDGVSYFDRNGQYTGFRINRVDGNTLVLPRHLDVQPGTVLYRTYNKKFDDMLAASKAVRKVDVDFSLRYGNGLLTLDAKDERGNDVSCSVPAQLSDAETGQEVRQRETLAKTGNTIYACRQVSVIGGKFVPQSLLTQLRRQALAALDVAQKANYRYGYRREENRDATCPAVKLTYADNVANAQARRLYAEHGVQEMEPAMEVAPGKSGKGVTVMHTRYCLRRELGICLKTDAGRKQAGKLFLRHGETTLALEFDCKNCEMKVVTT